MQSMRADNSETQGLPTLTSFLETLRQSGSLEGISKPMRKRELRNVSLSEHKIHSMHLSRPEMFFFSNNYRLIARDRQIWGREEANRLRKSDFNHS